MTKDTLTHKEALEALRFALNYPEDVILNRFNKYEDIYIKQYVSVQSCKMGLSKFFTRYNQEREHSSLDYNYPEEVYFGKVKLANVA